MKKHKVTLLILFFILLLSSCSYHSPFKDESYFSSLGEDGEVVLVVCGDTLENNTLFSLDERVKKIVSRVDRLTLSLKDENVLSVALEGNFSSQLLSFTPLKKSGSGKNALYKNGEYVLSSPLDGILLLSKEINYNDFYDRSIKNRKTLIDDATSRLIESFDAALYVKKPTFLPDLSLGINDNVVKEIEKALLLFSFDKNDVYLSGKIEVNNQKSAKSLLIALKNTLIQNIKRSGKVLDINEISDIFTINGNNIEIKNYHLTDENVKSISSFFSKVGEGVM